MATSMSEPLAPQNYTVPFAGGGFLGSNAIGVAAAQVIAADATRKSITFTNPNTTTQIALMVFPVTDINGNSLLGVTFASPGGGFPIVPGGAVTFNGDAARLAWAAVAASSANLGLTVVTSRT